MCLKPGFVDTWISQGESFADNVKFCCERRQIAEA